MRCRSSLVGCFCLALPSHYHAFDTNSQAFRAPCVKTISRTACLAWYGRGAEIWPPTNEGPVRLADSFPNGQVPLPASKLLQESSTIQPEAEKPVLTWKKLFPRAVDRILRRAASAQEEQAFSGEPGASTAINQMPGVAAVALLFMGLVRPLDVLLVSFLTGYFCILGTLASSRRQDGVTPLLPALPPNGHVPSLVSNPLGYKTSYSEAYDQWLKAGVLIGLVGPLVLTMRYALMTHDHVAARWAARPLFLLCCQAVTEAVSRRIVMTPLPIRILIPVAYNTVRLGYLWNWSFAACGLPGRFLAISNLLYWSANLFGFLLPVAVVRYMRAHFFGVEAEQVVTRSGMEESVGLSGYL